LIVVGQAAVATKRHWDMLERKEQRELTHIVRKSKGIPSNLSKSERKELGRLLKKLKLGRLGRDVAGIATGARRGKKH
jgi:hypothetical protein